VPDGLGTTGGIGDIALSANGQYVVQTTVSGDPFDQGGSSAKALPNCVVLHGTIGEPLSRRVVAAQKSTALDPRLRSTRALAEGTSIYGPRITSDGIPVTVLHLDASHLALFLGGDLIAQTGGLSPLNNTIVSLSPPCCGGENRIYYVLFSAETTELVVHDGVQARTILALGDRIDGLTLVDLDFGQMQNQVDLEDRLVLIAEYDDGTSAVVIGTPV
jgi:hypothetical protein